MAFDSEEKLSTIEDPEVVAKPIAFLDPDDSENAIMCHVDAIARIDDVDYSVGFPCDHAVDFAYVDKIDNEEGLILVENDDPIVDELFPICKQILAKEYPTKITLHRTPATLTLKGDLGIEENEDDENDVEVADILLTTEHNGKEYKLVRPTDIMLLVGRVNEENKEQRILINDDESDEVMPALMEML
eukprot:CAMPEP_0178915260 /NCGR_PEP_ID=MMETSP0786-20121207/11923_1 /TAXON_ID=186022 /ORGANISM="Thalassionema frauenfeldii, Strain CCMP 1798" /LENGTH=187 /DNA_ID=CAMNT_0020588341 /DNA_START=272 /DNA_END=832 /DNA_ORIENTATION=+